MTSFCFFIPRVTLQLCGARLLLEIPNQQKRISLILKFIISTLKNTELELFPKQFFNYSQKYMQYPKITATCLKECKNLWKHIWKSLLSLSNY